MDSGTLWEKFNELGCSLDNRTCQDVNWMSKETSMEPFTRWFLENISAENVLNYGELEEYQKICDAGEELHGEELDNALRKAGFPIDDLPVEAFDILEEKDEICFLKDQADALSTAKNQLERNMEKWKKEELVLQKKLNDEQKVCRNDGQVLMMLNVHIKNSLGNAYQSLQKLTSMCLNYKNADKCHFLAQAPLGDFLLQCDTFEQNVKVFIKRQFEGKELGGIPTLSLMFSDEFDDKEESKIFNSGARPGELKIHPESLWEAEVRRISSVANFRGVKEALKHAELLDVNALTLYRVRSEKECSVLEAELELMRQHEVSTAAQVYIVAKIAAIAEDFARRRIERRRYLVGKLETLRDILTRHVVLTDVLWMLLRREKKLVHLTAEFIEEHVSVLREEHSKHLAVMELHRKCQEAHTAFKNSTAKGHVPLVDSLRRMMGLEEGKDISAVVNTVQELSKRVKEVDRKRFMTESFDLDLGMEKSLKCLKEYLFAGPTREPVLIPADIAQKIGSVENFVGELETEIKRLERDFSSKQELYTKYPLQRDGRLLWAWFLAAPSKLFAALERAKRAAEK